MVTQREASLIDYVFLRHKEFSIPRAGVVALVWRKAFFLMIIHGFP